MDRRRFIASFSALAACPLCVAAKAAGASPLWEL
jgi:hypothetical protein